MFYYANPCGEMAREAMRAGRIGFIATPKQGNRLEPDARWCADNGCFSEAWKAETWRRWLTTVPPTMDFAVCPDVVADNKKTLEMFNEHAPFMESLGLPIAFVGQDGATPDEIPWERIATLFVGGSTEWKTSGEAVHLMQRAKHEGKTVHVGRVNSFRRLRWARDNGADTADGTHLTFNPTENLASLLRWLIRLEQEQPLTGLAG